MYKVFQVVVLCLIFLTSCKDKIICPAFQSTYILDDSTRLAYYSYAWKLDEGERQEFIDTGYGSGTSATEDMAPPPDPTDTSTSTIIAEAPMMEYFAYAGEYVVDPYPVKKNKYGVMKLPPFIYKNYLLKMAPMENVLGPEEEESEIIDEGEFVAEDFVETDSLTEGEEMPVALAEDEDSEQQEPEQRYLFKYDPTDNFNVDQEYYNKYFGELFIDNSPPEPEVTEEEMALDSAASEKKGFFKGIFGKKKDKKDKKKNRDEEEDEAEEDISEDLEDPQDPDPKEEEPQ